MGGKIIATLVSILLLIPGCVESDAELIGQEYRDPPEAPDFTLKNQRGEEVSLSDYEGKVVIVAFIYTSCPDVCLIISANLDYVQENLGESSDKVEILSITIDPARDTVPHLYEWTNTMGYEWDHLTSDRASSIRAVWVLISFILLKTCSFVCHGEGELGFAIVHHFNNPSRIFMLSRCTKILDGRSVRSMYTNSVITMY